MEEEKIIDAQSNTEETGKVLQTDAFPLPVSDINPIDEAKKVLEENKKVLAQMAEERKRIEKATAEMLVNGRSYAGQTQKIETADEKWKREAKERYAGTGMDPT